VVELERAAPIVPVPDVARAAEHYRRLGFDVDLYGDGTEYAFARRGGVELHLSIQTDHDRLTTAGALYVWVSDADALADEWRGAGGRLVDPADTPYGLREGAHIDPDGNLIRFGSPLVD
jgi:hypothetical protein